MPPDASTSALPPAAPPPGIPQPPPAGSRRLLVAGAALAAVAVVLLTGLVVANTVTGGHAAAKEPAGNWQLPASPEPSATAPPSAAPAPPTVSLAATGDIILGDADRLPAGDGAGFFDAVAEALAADLVMGNLEQPLTEDTGYEKCDEDSTTCHAFRAPPEYAAHLHDGGFHLLNLANNHGNDYGPQGRANTQAALAAQGLESTGERDQITVVEVAGHAVAVVGFSPYAWTNDLLDHGQAADVVSRAASEAELVVVQVHMGAEGADATQVQPGPEEYFGEQRGDPMAFARVVIDAGADLVVGHGPHVLRGFEFYQGRLIAYSLGNFAGGGGTLNAAGYLGLGGVLKVSLYADGTFAGGEFISTHMYEAGLPQLDPRQRGLALVRELTDQDFPRTGAQFDAAGTITAPPAS